MQMPLHATMTLNDSLILYVDDDNTQGPWDGSMEYPYQSISDALTVAQDHSTVFIFDGVYHENLLITHPLTLTGKSQEDVTLESDDEATLIQIFQTERVTIQNLTITHLENQEEHIGTALSVNQSNSVVLTHLTITHFNTGLDISYYSSDCIIADVVVKDNTVGIDLCRSSNTLVYGNIIQENAYPIALFNSNGNVITQNRISDNDQKPFFRNSRDRLDQNYWGEETQLYFFTGTLTISFLGITIPWIKCDLHPVQSPSLLSIYPLAIMRTTSASMVLSLFDEEMPITCSNFIALSEIDFFHGIVFHRVIDDFVIQAGGYYQNGSYKESPFGTINLETHPEIQHVDGAISMARTNEPNSATSQFFICDGTQHSLDGNYAAFGVIVIGFDTLRAIASVETTVKHGFMQDWPVEDIIINDVTILYPSD